MLAAAAPTRRSKPQLDPGAGPGAGPPSPGRIRARAGPDPDSIRTGNRSRPQGHRQYGLRPLTGPRKRPTARSPCRSRGGPKLTSPKGQAAKIPIAAVERPQDHRVYSVKPRAFPCDYWIYRRYYSGYTCYLAREAADRPDNCRIFHTLDKGAMIRPAVLGIFFSVLADPAAIKHSQVSNDYQSHNYLMP